MFLGGTEMVFRAGEDLSAQESTASGKVEARRRVQVIPGVELHVRGDLPRLRQAEMRQLLERVDFLSSFLLGAQMTLRLAINLTKPFCEATVSQPQKSSFCQSSRQGGISSIQPGPGRSGNHATMDSARPADNETGRWHPGSQASQGLQGFGSRLDRYLLELSCKVERT